MNCQFCKKLIPISEANIWIDQGIEIDGVEFINDFSCACFKCATKKGLHNIDSFDNFDTPEKFRQALDRMHEREQKQIERWSDKAVQKLKKIVNKIHT